MSLGVVVKGPEGIVLAADSRVTLQAQREGKPPIQVNFDNATKLLSFQAPHSYVGVVTYGVAVIGLRTARSFIPEFEVTLQDKKEPLPVQEYAERLSDFFLKQWNKVSEQEANSPGMTFIVGGYDPGAPYGKVFLFNIPNVPDPAERNPGETDFGMTWGGQLQIASRIIQGYDPVLPKILKEELNLSDDKLDDLLSTLKENIEFSIPYQVLPLQDCVDLATFLIRTTVIAQDLAIGVRGVGGLTEVAVVTRTNGFEHLQQKKLRVS
jgi:20S proteasome alpha/beta subunit